MFSKDQTAGRVVCLADYKRVKKGAVVPESNELYRDVEDWLDEGNALAEFSGYPEIPMTEEQLKDWRESAKVSAFQAEQALADLDYLGQVEALMDDPDTSMKTRRAWRKAQEFRRMSPTVLDMAGALGLTAEQLDALFEHAATIEA